MRIIVDTNIVFSAILNPDSPIGQIILNGSKYFTFYTIEQLNSEIQDHESKILKISGLSRIDYIKLLDLIRSKIKFVNHLLIDDKNYLKAEDLTKDIDKDDMLFVGLALQFDCKLWSGDKKLIKGLHKKGFKKNISTDQLFELYLDNELKRREYNK